MKTRLFGIKTVDVNGTKVYTINIIINGSTLILSKILKDEFWKLNHQISMKNGISKIHFVYTDIDSVKMNVAKNSLFKILFAHKIQKLVNENYWVNNKENILWDTLAEVRDINGGYL